MTPKLLLGLILLTGFSIPLFARSSYTGYSHAPGRQTCAVSCHGNSSGTVTLDGFPLTYTPGQSYTITLGHSAGNSIRNFNGSCRVGTGTTNAGQITAGTATATYSVSGETNGVHLSSNSQNTASFSWTAPAAGTGTVRLYVAAYQGSNTNGQTTALTLIADEEVAALPELVLLDWQFSGDDDGDGIAEPGETLVLTASLENVGAGSASSVELAVSTDFEWITVLNGISTFPDLLPGQSASADFPFQLQISPDCPAISTADLALQITSAEFQGSDQILLDIGQRLPFWAADGEGDVVDWQMPTVGDWLNDWHLSTEDSMSPTHAWKCGDSDIGEYAAHADARLITPPILLQNWTRLSFMHRMDAEISGASPDSAYDGGVVEISLDDGASWIQLEPIEGYNKVFRWLTGGGNPATHPFTGGTPCYSGLFDWQPASFDLGDYTDQVVRFAFHFGSDDGTQLEGWYVDDLQLSGFDDGVAVSHRIEDPAEFTLLEAWPNPFNPTTSIGFHTLEAGPVRLSVYNMAGQLVRSLLDGPCEAGFQQSQFDGTGLASGVYLLRLETRSSLQTRRILLMK
ncbi:MAG: T9SS type A sorting domain-containing protein [Candidatus Delongbacteria bacterium]|nr:T9SS type A sorting domain-containing protein [Candidatus Cloacimonadota bacterium]MCB9472927.1 T9SS type A sorting domain-containing protein [Candidatus Delongbacteria bacterium]